MFDFIIEKKENLKQSMDSIERIEKKYLITFPPVLKDLYSVSLGGKIKLSVFDVNGIGCEVASIIPIIDNGYHFEVIVDSDREDGFIPKTFYPIASNRGGDLYYWDSNDESIYLVLGDDIENPLLICSSITDFINLIDKSIRQ